jgi:two-component system, sensor histidine kinase
VNATLPLAGPQRSAGRAVDHIHAVYVQTPATLISYALGALVVLMVFWPLVDTWQLAGWLAAVASLWGLRLLHHLHHLRYRRRSDAEEATLLAWRHGWRVLVLLQGAMCGLAVWLFWGLGARHQRLALILVVYSFCVGSVQLLATQGRVFVAFISLVLTPTIVRIAADSGESGHLQLALVVTILFCATLLMVRT